MRQTSEFSFGIYWWTLKNLKNQNFGKMKQIAGDIIILHMCTKNHIHMRYSCWDTKWDRIFCHFESFFALMPPNNLENQNFEKMTGFNLLGCDWWSKTRFWIFMTEFFVIMSLFTKRQKPLELKMDLWHLNNTKVVLTLWTLNYVDCVPLSCLYYLHNVLSQAK